MMPIRCEHIAQALILAESGQAPYPKINNVTIRGKQFQFCDQCVRDALAMPNCEILLEDDCGDRSDYSYL